MMQLKYRFSWLLVLLLASLGMQASAQPAPEPGPGEQEDAKEEIDRSPRVPTFPLNGDLAGELQVFTTAYEDTFAGIGNELALGYLELVKANPGVDRKSTRLNSSHVRISYAVFCLK